MPMVSILLPSYNHEKYIGIAIDSVLNQTFQDFELLISDDFSQDGTINVIKKYSDSRIKTNFFSENQGATINHRYLLNQVTGKYVALINSDDVWLPTRLEKGIAYLEEHMECAACFSWADFIDEYGNRITDNGNVFKQSNRTQAQWLYHFFINGNCICHPSILIRSDVYKELGTYNLSLRQLPDFDMWIRVIKKYQIHIIEESLVQHRRFISSGENTSSPTITNSIRDVMESYYILTTFFNDLKDELFKEAFQNDFRKKDANSHEELSCEKFFLMLDNKYYMPKISLLAAINYILKHYDKEGMAEVFKASYGFSLQDLHKITCKVDLLGILPRDINIEPSQDFDIETYLKLNKIKVLSKIFLNKNWTLYRLLKKLYFKFIRS